MVSDSNAEDLRLMERIAQGDEDAFAEFYRDYEKRVYHFILKKMNDSFESYDVLHEVFMDVWKNAERFEGRSKLSTWVFGIAFHKSIDRLRKKRPDQLDDEERDTVADEEGLSPMELVNATEESDHLRVCVDALSAAQRSVIQMAFYEDMSYGEIAEIIESPEGTVKTRIFHAKQALKQCVAKFMGALT